MSEILWRKICDFLEKSLLYFEIIDILWKKFSIFFLSYEVIGWIDEKNENWTKLRKRVNLIKYVLLFKQMVRLCQKFSQETMFDSLLPEKFWRHGIQSPREGTTGMGKGRDGTVPRIFFSVPLVPRDNHAGQSLENLSRSRSSRRLLSRSRLSRGFESQSRSRSWGLAGRDRNPDIVPGQPPIPGIEDF